MKLLYQSEKYIRHSMSVARRAQKRRLSKCKKRKSVRRATLRMSAVDRHEWHTKQRYKKVIKAPANLAFLDDPDSVSDFITRLESALEQTTSLYVEMKVVVKIDYPTIAALLSVLYRSKKKGIKINGSMPKDELARNIFAKSGFIYTLFTKTPDACHQYDITADDQLFTLDTRDLLVVDEIVSTVSLCVNGENKKIPGLYTTLGELMDNTATHASGNKGEIERWWLSVNYDRVSKKVSFVFMDYGVGIFTSLLVKKGKHPVKNLLERAHRAFGNDATEEHLKSIVTESAGTTYNLSEGRGEGIYGIYQAMQRGELKNLHIISNNAFGDVSRGDYRRLKKELNGTLYYWEICDNKV